MNETKDLKEEQVTAEEAVATSATNSQEDTDNTALYLEWEPRPFDAFAKVSRINSKDFATMIREQYQQNFFDCVGCFIDVDNTGRFRTTLYFQDKEGKPGSDQIKNLVNVTNTKTAFKTDNLYYGMSAMNKRILGKTYELTEETKILLSDVMYGGRNAKRKWNELITERIQSVNPALYQRGAKQVVVGVTGLDINLLCRKLFGSRMTIETVKEGDKIINRTSDARYQCTLSKTELDGSFMINIEQIDPIKIDQIMRAENPAYVQHEGIRMY